MKDALVTRTPGRLTIGTDRPAYEPWFSQNDPSNGRGYESAVGYAVARRLGYARTEVDWVDVPFATTVGPAPKPSDLALNQVSISDGRRAVMDFSSPYYTVRQAVITYEGSPIAGVTRLADLRGATLGAQAGSTSLTAITEGIAPVRPPRTFPTGDAALQALRAKRIDGLVVDVPTAFFMTGAQLDNGVIVGQLPAGGRPGEEFGVVLDKGSSLTSCVSRAIDGMRTDGTLTRLQQQWLARAGAPELS